MLASRGIWACVVPSVLTWIVVMTGSWCCAQETQREPLDFFENRVRPLLVQHCLECHGSGKSEAGLRLDHRDHLLAGGDSGAAIVPGEAAQSLLITAVLAEGDLEMPPDQRLDDEEIRVLKQWINEGAVWPDSVMLETDGPQLRSGAITEEERRFWSFQPLSHVAPPVATDGREGRTAIDRWIAARLKSAGLEFNPPASKRELIRRATLDLTGLPPTPEDVQDFLDDETPEAFQKVVDRLLDSSAYGERWGRHWLDVVRYADTAGETADYPVPLAYKYRNWVIDALNNDMPYDEFVRQQLAGDLLAEIRLGNDTEHYTEEELALYEEMLTATGFVAVSRRFGFDVENYHHLTIQDTIDTVGQAFLGLSLGCARCHDHKYDPVNMDDYYAWYGIFESTRYSFPGSEEKKRPYDLFPVLPRQLAERRQAEFDQRLASLDSELQTKSARLEMLADQWEWLPSAGPFNGFESEILNQPPGKLWGPLGTMMVTGEAQSPFENVFQSGVRGISAPSNGDNNAIGCKLDAAYTASSTPHLYYNIDFRNTAVAEGQQGAYRFYVGRGPGNSAALEMASSPTHFLVKNGAAYEPICELVPGRWYNLQVTLNLRDKTYQGTIADGQSNIEFEGKRFTDGWDGIVDYTFVDRYGPGSGATPGHDLDNLMVSLVPLLSADKRLVDETRYLHQARWQGYVESRKLLTPGENQDGHQGYDVWHANPLPVIGVNRSQETLEVPGRVPPGAVVVHPQEREGVGVLWRSPFTGSVDLTGFVEDAHDCGDSVLWFIDRLATSGLQPLSKGEIGVNGRQSLQLDLEQLRVEVQAGDWIQLAIMPKSNYGCDLTRVGLTLREVNGERVWDLEKDLVEELLAGNPHPDQYGHPDCWTFVQVEEDRGEKFGNFDPQVLAAGDLGDIQQQLTQLESEIQALQQQREKLVAEGAFQRVYAAIDQDEPHDAVIQLRGDKARPGDLVPRRNLAILGGEAIADQQASGRLDLAEWVLAEDNPLVLRVIVNRIWQHHFGRGLVGTENDFGTRGEKPSHPELLDWLCHEFVDSGWSLKAMHRLIMNTEVYQQSSQYDPLAAEMDPEARLLWRYNRRRLSAEEIRDSMLMVSQLLDRTVGQEHPFPPEDSWGFSQHAPYYGVYETDQRSIYLMQQRLKRHPFLGLFDGADTNVSTARRMLTTVPTQSLYLMNDPFVHRCSESLASRVLESEVADEARLTLMYRKALLRDPEKEEVELGLEFVGRYQNALPAEVQPDDAVRKAWSALGRSLLTRNEFLFVD